jgi:hypothetical protein
MHLYSEFIKILFPKNDLSFLKLASMNHMFSETHGLLFFSRFFLSGVGNILEDSSERTPKCITASPIFMLKKFLHFLTIKLQKGNFAQNLDYTWLLI